MIRTDLKRQLSATLVFNALSREEFLPIPTADGGDLRDVRFSFRTSCNRKVDFAGHRLVPPRDLRFYVNGVDHTSEVLAELKSALNALDVDRLRTTYLTAASRWVEFEERLGEPSRAAEDRSFLESFSSARLSVADALTDLFTSDGWSNGRLHPCHFLYSHISLPMLGLQAIVDRHAERTGQSPAPLNTQGPLILAFSQGPAPSYEAIAQTTPHGEVYVQAIAAYENPLAELLEQTIDAVREAVRSIDNQRTRFVIPTMNEVDETRAELAARIGSVSTRIDDLWKLIERLLEGDSDEG